MIPLDNTDLEHLNYTELLEERASVRARAREIIAEKAVSGRPDDKHYRRWRRGINTEHAAINTRLDCIKLELFKRQQAYIEAKGVQEPPLTRDQLNDLEKRRAKLRADLTDGGPDALLLRCRRLIGHLLTPGMTLEEIGLDADDCTTVRDVSVYLRARYGSTPLKEAMA